MVGISSTHDHVPSENVPREHDVHEELGHVGRRRERQVNLGANATVDDRDILGRCYNNVHIFVST